jgi:RNA 3'-terminal phosphate cyclase
VAVVIVEHFLGERQNGDQANYLNDLLYEPTHISSPLTSIVFKTIKACPLILDALVPPPMERRHPDRHAG